MNASERWVKEFVKHLECVKCRSKADLMLYGYDRKPIDASTQTLENLQNRVVRMDVWCKNCEPKINTRVTSKNRNEHRAVAAQLANMGIQGSLSQKFDKHVTERGTFTRQEIIDHAKGNICYSCGSSYPRVCITFQHVEGSEKIATIQTMNHSKWTLEELLTELEKCTTVCLNCQALIKHKLTSVPQTTVKLDEYFWSTI